MRKPLVRLLVLLLAAVCVAVFFVGCGGGDGDGEQDQADRKVIFIQGIDSASGNCGKTFHGKVSWMVDYLTQALWVREFVPSLDSPDDFFYFSYSGLYCKGDFQQPSYEKSDTCAGVADAAGKLHALVESLIAVYPKAKVDIIAHSMGGMVAAEWLWAHPDMQPRVNSIVTFDSPVRGVPNKNPFSSCDTSTSLSWNDLWCKDYTQIPEKCASIIVPTVAGLGEDVPFFTIDATQHFLGIEFVPGDRTTLLPSKSLPSESSRLHCQFDDGHSSVWKNKRIGGNDPVKCWLHVITAAEPASFQIVEPSRDVKAVFVACAVTRPVESESCEAKLRGN